VLTANQNPPSVPLSRMSHLSVRVNLSELNPKKLSFIGKILEMNKCLLYSKIREEFYLFWANQNPPSVSLGRMSHLSVSWKLSIARTEC